MTPLTTIYRLVAGILLLAGAPFVCVGVYEAWEMQQFISASGQATGTVADNTYIVTNEGGTESGAYYPVVEFEAEGNKVRFQDGVGSLPPDYAVGEAVEVLYERANPREARIRSWKRLWLAPAIFMVVGALPAGVFGLWWAVAGRQMGKRPEGNGRRRNQGK